PPRAGQPPARPDLARVACPVLAGVNRPWSLAWVAGPVLAGVNRPWSLAWVAGPVLAGVNRPWSLAWVAGPVLAGVNRPRSSARVTRASRPTTNWPRARAAGQPGRRAVSASGRGVLRARVPAKAGRLGRRREGARLQTWSRVGFMEPDRRERVGRIGVKQRREVLRLPATGPELELAASVGADPVLGAVVVGGT